MPPRSRSLRTSPILPEIEASVPSAFVIAKPIDLATSIHQTLMPSPEPSHTRSESPIEKIVKRKKVKLHRCPECHKDFPR